MAVRYSSGSEFYKNSTIDFHMGPKCTRKHFLIIEKPAVWVFCIMDAYTVSDKIQELTIEQRRCYVITG